MTTTERLTLPGDIPGLLRRGSPVLYDGVDDDVVMITDGSDQTAYIAEAGSDDGGARGGWVAWSELALDLSDPTGRAHAAWFALHPTWDEPIHTLPTWLSRRQFAELMAHAIEGRDMEPHRINLLRRTVLHVAGREVTA